MDNIQNMERNGNRVLSNEKPYIEMAWTRRKDGRRPMEESEVDYLPNGN